MTGKTFSRDEVIKLLADIGHENAAMAFGGYTGDPIAGKDDTGMPGVKGDIGMTGVDGGVSGGPTELPPTDTMAQDKASVEMPSLKPLNATVDAFERLVKDALIPGLGEIYKRDTVQMALSLAGLFAISMTEFLRDNKQDATTEDDIVNMSREIFADACKAASEARNTAITKAKARNLPSEVTAICKAMGVDPSQVHVIIAD